ncbi:flagellar FliJ protein [Alkalibaculum bacchi]|uniref:Flagellar FliJ protein n=2 Tax=Alkalibaculum bacchi TaxID=645887 RepID=A0A366IHW6_9FIRM|nr:flagellar export protein FliJ [Alkalibaculum bacchi]RBP70104.1 flagellar FliJ protein [Alkalibaculum bacchi]
MKTYKFSMEKVLELRANKEKTSMENFASMQRDLMKQKSKLIELRTEEDSIKLKSNRCKNIVELRQLYLCKEWLEKRIQAQLICIEESRKNLEKARQELISAQKDRKIIEKLKEKDFEAYQDSEKAIEQKNLDEMAVLKYEVVRW